MKIDLGGIGLVGVSWIHLAQDEDQLMALVNAAMNFL
jgi:hypothetical protein